MCFCLHLFYHWRHLYHTKYIRVYIYIYTKYIYEASFSNHFKLLIKHTYTPPRCQHKSLWAQRKAEGHPCFSKATVLYTLTSHTEYSGICFRVNNIHILYCYIRDAANNPMWHSSQYRRHRLAAHTHTHTHTPQLSTLRKGSKS